MRIIGGQFRGHKLKSPENTKKIRPTSDRVREALFNILEHANWTDQPLLNEDAAILDLFAGTGALGLEALSRSSGHAVFIDQKPKLCGENIEKLGLEDHSHIIGADIHRLPLRPEHIAPRSLAFIDPPYGENLGEAALRKLASQDWLAPGAICIVEMDKRKPENIPDEYKTLDTRTYGDTTIIFAQKL